MRLLKCFLVVDGHEFSRAADGGGKPNVSWECIREVMLPFTPRRGMRFSGILPARDEDLVWTDADTTENDDWGWRANLVSYDVSREAFVARFFQVSIQIPWEST